MKIIDLLNKIAKEKKYPKIKFNNSIYEYHDKEHGYCRYYHDNTYICLNTDYYLFDILNDEVEILEEEKKTIDDLNLSLQEIKTFQEASQIFLKLNNEEDKQTFIKLLLGEGTYERWIDYFKSKGE